ncbi:MAG TPA: TonB-dependent receptor [Polyangiaceae bacterium]|nr:TonB-dependent receptor [Polyangiaceae bacterium]
MHRDPKGRGCARALVALALALSALARPAEAQPPPPDVVPPKLVRNSEPRYPDEKRASGEGASVVLTLVVDAEGKVERASVASSAGPAFDAAALDAAAGLAFEPARRGGRAIAAKIPFRYDFRIEPAAPVPAPATAAGAPAGPGPAAGAPAPGAAATAEAASAPGTAALGAAALGAATPGAAAPGAAAPVEDIVVRGDRAPRETTRHSIGAAEVRTMPGANGDPLRAVEAMPGVARAPGLDGQLVVRGSAPADTLVLVDGTWVPTAYHFGGVSSVIPGDVLARVDYVPGNFGAEYGRAMGGVVELGVRSPRRDRLGAVAQVDLLDGRLLVEGPLGERTRVLVAGRRSWVDAWIGPVLRGAGVGVTAAPVYYDWQAVVEHDVSRETTARLLFFGSDDRLAIVVNAPGAQDPSGGPLAASTTFTRLQARTDTRLGEGSRLTNMVTVGTHEDHFAGGTDRADVSLLIGQARSDLRARLARGLALSAGLDVLWARYDIAFQLPATAIGDNEEDEPSASPFFGKARRKAGGRGYATRPGAYTTLEIAPAPGLRLLPGLRADWASDTQRWTLDPRLAARWLVAPGADPTTLKGGVGVFHQTPVNEALPPWGDGSVRSPRAVHASAGVEQGLGEHLSVSLEGFHKRLSRLFVTRPAGDETPLGVRFVNAGEGRVFGLEALVRWRGEGRLQAWLAYTLSRSERRESEREPYRLFQYDQTHVLGAVASYDLGRGWTLGGRFRLVSGPLSTPYLGGVGDYDAGAYEPVAGAPFSSRAAPFHRLDLRVEKAWALGPAKLKAYLDLQNAYNRRNPEGNVYSYDYARSAPASGLPILPILGLRGEL